MRTAWVIGLLLAISVATSAPVQAAPERELGYDPAEGPCKARVCVIRSSRGGDVAAARRAARSLLAGPTRRVAVDGPCRSACALFADLARERVCVTPRARFEFHKARLLAGTGNAARVVRREDPPHSPDIAGWVARRGGFPLKGFLTMPSAEARRFWRPC